MNCKYARFIDHTNLKPDATADDIAKLCSEAVKYHFASVCVNPCNVVAARSHLAGSGVNVCAVIGFPLGANTSQTKAFEAADAIRNGAVEIDMVINIGALKSRDFDLVRSDIKAVRTAAAEKLLKVIIETGLLNDEQKAQACMLASEEDADFVKTCTGFGTGVATVEDVILMKRNISPDIKIKASAGIRTLAAAKAMIDAGASRLGTSSGVAICEEEADASLTGETVPGSGY
jgi:deoxyribose-phosphate aldolase